MIKKLIKWEKIRKELVREMKYFNKFIYKESADKIKALPKDAMYPGAMIMDEFQRPIPIIKNVNDAETQKIWLERMYPGILENYEIDGDIGEHFQENYQCEKCGEYKWGQDLFKIVYLGNYEDYDGGEHYGICNGIFCKEHIPKEKLACLKEMIKIAGIK